MPAVAIRRSARRSRVTLGDSPPIRPVLPGMIGGGYRPLSQPEMERIHALVLRLLEELGLSQVTPTLEARAVAAGCRVDDGGRLRFPRGLVEDVIARSRRKFNLHGIDPRHDIEIGGRRVHTGTGGAAPMMMDFETGKYRESTVADLYDIARLCDRPENIHWYHRSVVARDAATALDLDLNTTYACLQGTSKSIAVSYTNGDSVRAVLPMLELVDGGEGRFRDRPFCTAVCCHVVPPMRFATESCETLEAAVEAGSSTRLSTMFSRGTLRWFRSTARLSGWLWGCKLSVAPNTLVVRALAGYRGGGGGTRTLDLRIMSPAL